MPCAVKNALTRAKTIASPQGWFITGLVYTVTMFVIARRSWHWGPDTRYYLAMTYRYLGFSEHEAGRQTYVYLGRFEWFKDFCYYACDPNSSGATFGHLFHGEVGDMVATRFVYPLLSAPFVWLIGPRGMLVVPFLAFSACLLLLMAFVSRTVGRDWSVLAAVMLIVPTTVSAYAIYTYTESLAMLFVMVCIMVLPLARSTGRRDLIVYTASLLLLAFTRQFHPVVVAAVCLAWLGAAVLKRKLRNEWLPFALSSVGVLAVAALVQSLVGPGYSPTKFFLDSTNTETTAGIPAAAVRVAVNLVKQEIWDIAHDIPLAITCAAAVIAVLYRFRSPIALLTLGALLGTFVLNVANTEPSHFRYYVTAYPFIVIAATAVFAELLQRTRPALFSFESGPAPSTRVPARPSAPDVPAARAEAARV